MSAVDVLAAMRIAEAYCYDAGAANAANNMKAARVAVTELFDALADFDGMDRADSGATPRLARLRAALANARGTK